MDFFFQMVRKLTPAAVQVLDERRDKIKNRETAKTSAVVVEGITDHIWRYKVGKTFRRQQCQILAINLCRGKIKDSRQTKRFLAWDTWKDVLPIQIKSAGGRAFL